MVLSTTSLVSLAFFVILFASVLAQEALLHPHNGPRDTIPYRIRSAYPPRYVVQDDDDDDSVDDDSDGEDDYYNESDADSREESDDEDNDKNNKKERKRLRKQQKEARKMREKAEKYCPGIIAAHRRTLQQRNEALAELDELRNSCADLGQRRFDLSRRKTALDDREGTLERQAEDLMAKEKQLERRRKILVEKERELEEREANLPTCKSPRRTPKPTPTTVLTPPASSAPAGICEACGSCEAGLECRMGTCQRKANDGPPCEMSETCGDGEERVCRELTPTDLTKAGSLQQKLQDEGKFLGNTSRIPGCVDGFVRYDCDNRKEVCPDTSSFSICFEKAVEECEEDGLTEISGDVPTIPAPPRTMQRRGMGVRQLGVDLGPICCLVFVSPSCFEQQVCTCRSTNTR